MYFDLKNITIKIVYKANFIENNRAFSYKKYGNYVNRVLYYQWNYVKHNIMQKFPPQKLKMSLATKPKPQYIVVNATTNYKMFAKCIANVIIV